MRKTALYLTLLGALAAAPAAQADTTLGTTTQPSGTTASVCTSGAVVGQGNDTPASPYLVPSGGGIVKGWQINTAGATAGEPLTFLIIRPNRNDLSGLVVATDSVTLPNPLPPSGIASFTLPAPVTVSGGDTFGLYVSSTSTVTCFFHNPGSTGSIPVGNQLFAWGSASTPTVGQALASGLPPSPAGFELNLAVTLAPPMIDAGVTTSAVPAGTSSGSLAVLSSVIANHGGATNGITFSDTVPAGLRIKSVLAPPGSCTTSGQHVTCTFPALTPGQQTSVAIAVSATSAGKYTNQVSVSPSGTADPVLSNNSASAVLTMSAPPKPSVRHCVVPQLKGTSPSVA
jgi:hypothetical protein